MAHRKKRKRRRRVAKTIAGYGADELEKAWSRGNNNGWGFDPSGDMHTWTFVGETSRARDGIEVYKTGGGLVGVGDAHGPWAVYLEDESGRPLTASRRTTSRRSSPRTANPRGRPIHIPGYGRVRSDMMREMDLRGLDLSRKDLSNASLYKAEMENADLSGADLSYANLFSADLSGADLSYANLNKANMTYTILLGADLSGADLSYANLTGAVLERANLEGANLERATLPEDFLPPPSAKTSSTRRSTADSYRIPQRERSRRG